MNPGHTLATTLRMTYISEEKMKTSPQNMPNVLMFLVSGVEDLEAVTIMDVCG